ncbi:MAG: dephospho-CoA kinase [Acidobacteriota bacterium]
MLLAGLTGGLASGKSFIGRALEECGCLLIHADELGHEVLGVEGPAYAGVLAEFGDDILKDDGTIDRRKLGTVVFADNGRLARLNELVHPHVFALQEERIAALAARDPDAIVVVEAAIMIETGSYKRYDAIILAVCAVETQIARAIKRDGLTRDEVLARLSRQMALAEKIPYAQFVIDTDHTKEETITRTREVHESLRAMQQSKSTAASGTLPTL